MYKQIVAILADQLQIDPAKIRPSTEIVDELGADSLDVVEILMTLENEFNISVPDEEIENFRTPIDIQKYIVAKTQPE
ncbi:MAG: acyl carrier protein [Ruminococcaceae bacterium]|nr:acyl carrier protein [Oscillospiraceae bacterium]